MKEVPYNGTDKFVREDVTVTVTCKPKTFYPSSATNWFNDLYLFPEEHELELDTDPVPDNQDPSPDHQEPTPPGHKDTTLDHQYSSEHHKISFKREQLTSLLVVRDSLFQFEMMNLKNDYMQCVEGEARGCTLCERDNLRELVPGKNGFDDLSLKKRGVDEVLSLTQDEFNALESKRQEEISKLCAKEIERRYRRKRCLGTSIHSRTPSYSHTYYFKQLQFVKDHYTVHDGAIDGICNGCFDGKKMCDVHQSTLGCNWRGPPVHRVPAPVPCYKGDRSGFHCTNPDLFSDAPEKERKIDEFCPRAKLKEAVKKVGPIQIKEREVSIFLYCSVFNLQNYSLPGLTLLESMLQTWVMCAKQTRCSRRFPSHCIPNGATFYYGTTRVPNGRGGYM
ncbi:unnamed protein product [Porites lobata]|uniref:Uncharacterized protein n=1 Tax=Porites lobata TaxID=104759 RepID=A0ABN8MUL6_9CNID|nr:unnamed protein product [Porites lobata]